MAHAKAIQDAMAKRGRHRYGRDHGDQAAGPESCGGSSGRSDELDEAYLQSIVCDPEAHLDGLRVFLPEAMLG